MFVCFYKKKYECELYLFFCKNNPKKKAVFSTLFWKTKREREWEWEPPLPKIKN